MMETLSFYVAADPQGVREDWHYRWMLGLVEPKISGVVFVLQSMTRLLPPPSTQKRMACRRKNMSATGKEDYGFLIIQMVLPA